jgi:hypothetical protein
MKKDNPYLDYNYNLNLVVVVACFLAEIYLYESELELLESSWYYLNPNRDMQTP